MKECCLPAGISALACAIAEKIPDNSELTLLSAVLMQLADTLATIAAVRACRGERTEQERGES